MFIHWKFRRCCLPALFALLSMLSTNAVAHAADADGSGEPDEGWRKVLAYGRCAFAVFSAVTPVQWAAAALDCGRLYLDEPPIGEGGK